MAHSTWSVTKLWVTLAFIFCLYPMMEWCKSNMCNFIEFVPLLIGELINNKIKKIVYTTKKRKSFLILTHNIRRF